MKKCRGVAGKMKIGVLALQGAFLEHKNTLLACGVEVVEVRLPKDLAHISALVIPGGESTTIGKLMVQWGLIDAIKTRAEKGMPIFGSCAGMILLCDTIIDSEQPRLGLVKATVRRNAFGRQKESFEAPLYADILGDDPLNAVFIRAPYLETADEEVRVLAKIDEKIILAQQGHFLLAAFHAELTQDTRLHQYFIQMILNKLNKLSL